ncbi:MAG: CoA pyrophosphatase [Proteobacteria bacterium]|nr:CoA pyrophosphatase [Pseudomonadota bacterium]
MISLIKEKLNSYIGKILESPQDICAGVMIPIFEKDGETFIVLTKRTEMVKAHKGEVSFPGGMCEDEDSSKLNTALRECFEEIGLRKKDVRVIGKLDDMITFTGFVISPYVGIMPYPYTFKTNPQEVAYLIYLPLKFLMETDPVMEQAEYEGRVEQVPSFHYNGDRIWGATCRILLQFRNILKS